MTVSQNINALNETSPLSERLNAVRLLIVLAIAFGYASTMPSGPGTAEWGHLFGYDPSWIGIQLLFFISGILAMRSIMLNRTGLIYLASRIKRNLPPLLFLTVATLFILFPLFGTPPDEGFALFARLTKYVALTVFCIDPGIPLEGLLDDARYMCLVQGGIWTLRYGLILHFLTAITGRLGLLSIKPLLLLITLFTTLAYGLATYFAVKNDLTYLATPIAGLRLSYAFLFGMTVWSYKDLLHQWDAKLWWFCFIIFSLTALNHLYGPWSPAIEIGLTLFWMAVAWGALTIQTKNLNWMKFCPNLTLPVMLINWPLAQTLLLINPDINTSTLIIFTLIGTLVLSLVYVFGVSKTAQIAFKATKKRRIIL